MNTGSQLGKSSGKTIQGVATTTVKGLYCMFDSAATLLKQVISYLSELANKKTSK